MPATDSNHRFSQTVHLQQEPGTLDVCKNKSNFCEQSTKTSLFQYESRLVYISLYV